MAMLERELSVGRRVWVIEHGARGPDGKRESLAREHRVISANAQYVAVVASFPFDRGIKFVLSADCFVSREEAQRSLTAGTR